MSVLVTGGAGYIGSHMVWELLYRGEDVVVVDSLQSGFEWAVAPEAELVVADISDSEAIEAVIERCNVDAIIHFAGSIVVPESVADPLSYYLNNTVKSRALIASAVKTGVKNFIFSSTAAVYGSPEMTPVVEEAQLSPESPYGSSKLMTEIMLRDTAAAHDFRYTCLRYFNVAGADPAGRTGQSTKGATHLIKVACEAAMGKRDHVQIYGTDYPTADGTCVRDYIHVTDLARAHALALQRLRDGGGSVTLNCGYGRGFSVREVLSAVGLVSGKTLDLRESPRRPGDATAIVADASQARDLLGWTAEHDDLEEIISHALKWEDHLGRRNTPR